MNLFATIVVVSAVIAATVAVPVNVSSSPLNDIHDEIEFLRHHTKDLPISLPLYSPANALAAQQFRCYIDAIDQVAETHNLGTGWVNARKELVPLVDSLSKCENGLCTLYYFSRSLYVLARYLDQVRTHNPEAHKAIIELVGEQCYNPNPNISDRDAKDAESFRCFLSVIDKVVEEHNLGERWAEVKKEVVPNIDAMEKCTDADCTINHVITAGLALMNYLDEVYKSNPKAFEAIDEQIKEQC